MAKKRGSVKRRRKLATARSRQSMDPLWRTLDTKIGGKEGLLEAAIVSQSPKAQVLAELLGDVAYSKSGTKDLAKKAGMSAPEIVDMFRDKKWLETTLALHDRLPEIVQGAAEDAGPSFVPCEECKGSGMIDKHTCWVCGGEAEVRKPGDKSKLAFVGEAAGLVSKKGPVAQVNVQVNSPGSGVSFEELMRKAVVITGNRKVIDVGTEQEDEHTDSQS